MSKFRIINRVFFGLLLVIALSSSAYATPADEAKVGTASPGRVEEQFGVKDLGAKPSAPITIKEMAIAKAPAGFEKVKFKLKEIKIEGVVTYKLDDLKSIYADKIGQTISLTDLYGIAAEITRKYRKDGYVLTQVVVPPQTIDKGIAKLLVVEGFINKIDVQGTENDKEARLIKAYADKIHAGKGAVNIKDVERALLLINDLPGITARSIISPSPNTVGAADISILLEHNKIEGAAGINNYGTRYLGPVQAEAGLSLNSYFGNNEQISGKVVAALSNQRSYEMAYASLNYTQPFGTEGTKISFTGSNTRTEPGASLDEFDVKGLSNNLSAQIEHPFERSRSLSTYGNIMFDYTNVNSKDNLGSPTMKDRVRAVRIGSRTEYLDTLIGAASNTINITLSKGVDMFNANKDGQTNISRTAAGDPNFTKMNVELQRQQRLSDRFHLLLGAKGQYTRNALLSGEEFGFGGINYGRGYDNSEIIGDKGLAGKAELHWSNPVRLAAIPSYDTYAFYDAGRIWNFDASTPLQNQTRISTGVGVKANLSPQTTADILVAFPLNRSPATQGDEGARVFAGLNKKF